MMINKMLSHWKIARCARASQLYHRGPPLKLQVTTQDLGLFSGRWETPCSQPGPGPFKQSDVITGGRER